MLFVDRDVDTPDLASICASQVLESVLKAMNRSILLYLGRGYRRGGRKTSGFSFGDIQDRRAAAPDKRRVSSLGTEPRFHVRDFYKEED